MLCWCHVFAIYRVREQGEKAADTSRISALTELMKAAGLSLQEGADVVADVVNAMVVRCVAACTFACVFDRSLATALTFCPMITCHTASAV